MNVSCLNSSQADRYSIYLAQRDRRLSWSWWFVIILIWFTCRSLVTHPSTNGAYFEYHLSPVAESLLLYCQTQLCICACVLKTDQTCVEIVSVRNFHDLCLWLFRRGSFDESRSNGIWALRSVHHFWRFSATLWNVHTNFCFSDIFSFWVKNFRGTERRTDGRTDVYDL